MQFLSEIGYIGDSNANALAMQMHCWPSNNATDRRARICLAYITSNNVPEFQLDARLINDSLPMLELKLCSLRLMNDCRFPWLLLVPRRADCVEILDLDENDQDLLWAEIRQVAGTLREIVQPDKLNIAALGNVVAQLHVHVIARFHDDDAWPAPVWGVGQARPWDDGGRELILALRQALSGS